MDPLCQSGPRVEQTLLFQLNRTCFYSLIKSSKKIVIECLPCARHCSSDTIMERISKIFTNIYIWMGGNKSCKQGGPYKNVMISENGHPRAGWPNGGGWRILPGWGSGNLPMGGPHPDCDSQKGPSHVTIREGHSRQRELLVPKPWGGVEIGVCQEHKKSQSNWARWIWAGVGRQGGRDRSCQVF